MGGPCYPGFYCPEGSAKKIKCDPGTYCQTATLSAPTGNCSAGYYCTLEASSFMPTDNTTGNICPMGHSCPEGSSTPTVCETGYFLNVTGSDDNSDCIICTVGKYCPGTGNPEPAGTCDPGYYCPIGQNDSAPADYNCPAGHYCPGDTDDPIQCENGYYQTLTTQTTCDICHAGYYCDNTANIAFATPHLHVWRGITVQPEQGSTMNSHVLKEHSTISQVGLEQESDCTLCLGGYACPVTGMTQMLDIHKCAAGYFCQQGANTTTPDQGSDANICPDGKYCPLGTTDPISCPMGTYSNNTVPGLPCRTIL
ncbi:hypothetical protein MAR_036215 [Mya arenaria]|uniref:Uncharacterized protein n=1 Tax=Mya arenaria TaxID=6604 RepID=A0ABY7EQB3_MYAAR|nr:hypothetical protein MAR_036215 [Mya arenaria]